MFKSPPQDLRIEGEVLNNFCRAVVEDNNDPLKANRVRVRIHGRHASSIVKTETDGIPVEELPWAEPAMPIHQGSISGFGQWSVPLQGSHVMVFFENGNPMKPIYFASLPGIPESQESYSNNNRENNSSDGFKDPDGVYPLNTRLGEPDVHRLAREETEDTIVETKNNNRDTGISIAGGGTWDEPVSPYNTQYPHNHVIATHGGIIIELDSTSNAKRINIHHPSNSFIEIDNDGNMVIKNNGEKYEIIANGKNIHINQQRNTTIGGNSNKKIGSDENIEVGGDKSEDITGDMDQTIGGSKTEDITSDKDETIGGDKSENISGSKSETIGSNKTETITGSKSETIGTSKTENIGAALNIIVTGAAAITAGGTTTVTAPTINLTGLVNLANQASMAALLTAAAASIYDSHTHDHGDPAGTTDPPNQTMGTSVQTVNTQAS